MSKLVENLKFGEYLTDDVYGRPIHIGDCVDEIHGWGKSYSPSRYIAIGITGGGNLRIINVIEDSLFISRSPGYRLVKSPKVDIPWKPRFNPRTINMYSSTQDEDERERMFHKFIQMIKTG